MYSEVNLYSKGKHMFYVPIPDLQYDRRHFHWNIKHGPFSSHKLLEFVHSRFMENFSFLWLNFFRVCSCCLASFFSRWFFVISFSLEFVLYRKSLLGIGLYNKYRTNKIVFIVANDATLVKYCNSCVLSENYVIWNRIQFKKIPWFVVVKQ